MEEPKDYDFIKPTHYQQNESGKETWEEMVDEFGLEAFLVYCKITAYKYQSRAGKKPGQSAERDLAKAKWYLDKVEELSK